MEVSKSTEQILNQMIVGSWVTQAIYVAAEIGIADFLAAGGDLGAAMGTAGWGENEQQELLCAFVALRGEVVTR